MSRFAGRRLSVSRLAVSALTLVTAVGSVYAALTLPDEADDGSVVAGAPLDSRWFAPYYDVTLETGEALGRSAFGTADGGAVLGFVVAAGPQDCTPAWGTYDLDTAARDFELDRRVVRMQDRGEPVAVSFGGAINTELALACPRVAALTRTYGAVLDRYGSDLMDLDIEGATMADAEATERRAIAVARLQAQRPADDPLEVWLTLPVAPDGLTAEGLAQVDALLEAGVDLAGVNAMTMNYGVGAAVPLIDIVTGSLEATADQVAERWATHGRELPAGGAFAALGATPMIGVTDVEGEVFSIVDAHELSDFASERGLARMSMWSLNRDQTCGTNYRDTDVVATACSGVEQAGETFAEVLGADRNGTPAGREIEGGRFESIADDPDTSPFPVWSSQTFYSAGVKVVWNGGVYVAKWWNDDGPAPDDPMLDVSGSPWTYLGPVLPGDAPYSLPRMPAGTFPAWSATTLYDQGDRVMFRGTGYVARWWSQGKRPDVSALDHDYSPWRMLTAP